MQKNWRPQTHPRTLVAAALLAFLPCVAKCQSAPAASSSSELASELKSLMASVSQLQSQVQTLSSQMTEMRTAQQQALLEAEQLRAELNRTREQLAAKTAGTNQSYEAGPHQDPSPPRPSVPAEGRPLPGRYLPGPVFQPGKDHDMLT